MSSILQKVAPIGEARDKEILKEGQAHIYRQTPQGDVQAHFFFPPDELECLRDRPVVVFFHDGFWDSAMPTQFVPHCLHFASRGAVAVAAETRLASRNGTGPLEALEDARELIRWIRRNADELGIDPRKIVVGGAGGGAWLALLTSMPKDKEMPSGDGVECRAQAVLLFSALLNTTPKGQMASRFPDSKSAKKLSPSNQVRRKLPPMILFHGKNDRVTPLTEAQKFARRLRWRGNVCELVDFEKADHSFFNFNVSHLHFELTVGAADRFLVEKGILPAPAAEVENPVAVAD